MIKMALHMRKIGFAGYLHVLLNERNNTGILLTGKVIV